MKWIWRNLENDGDEDHLPLVVLMLNLPVSMPFDDYVDIVKDENLHKEEEDGKETREHVPICSLSDAKNIWRKSAAIFFRTMIQSRKIQPQ